MKGTFKALKTFEGTCILNLEQRLECFTPHQPLLQTCVCIETISLPTYSQECVTNV